MPVSVTVPPPETAVSSLSLQRGLLASLPLVTSRCLELVVEYCPGHAAIELRPFHPVLVLKRSRRFPAPVRVISFLRSSLPLLVCFSFIYLAHEQLQRRVHFESCFWHKL